MDADAPTAEALQRELREYYRPLLPHWDRTLADRGDLELWSWAAEAWSGRPVLELGAGSGRISRRLAGAARPLVALDLNPEALRRAQTRLGRRRDVHLVLADMRSFRLDARFALVAAANDPFSHLRTGRGRDRALRRVAEHLAPGGRFLLDALWFSGAWLEEASSEEGKTTEHRPDTDGEGDLVVRQTWRCRPRDRRCRAEYRCFAGGELVARAAFDGRYWTRDEVDRRLERAGLRVDEVWGSYGRRPWTPQSDHMVVLARPA